MLYQMTIFPVTLGDPIPELPQFVHFSLLFTSSYWWIYRDFKFDVRLIIATDDKLSHCLGHGQNPQNWPTHLHSSHRHSKEAWNIVTNFRVK